MIDSPHPAAIEKWYKAFGSPDLEGLDELLADDVVFQSPVVHTPQVGRAITSKYLRAANHVLHNDSFRYVNEWTGASSAVLEFETAIGNIAINGIDMITFDEAGKITNFKVMVRPLKAINLLHQLMMRALQQKAA